MHISFAYAVEPNQVIVHKEQVDLGPYRASQYAGLVDEELTRTWIVPRILTWELQAYLNQYFPGWRLLRRVVEVRRHEKANPYKNIYYVIQVGTDADAETLRSHLEKSSYRIPT